MRKAKKTDPLVLVTRVKESLLKHGKLCRYGKLMHHPDKPDGVWVSACIA
jgi:hypothetical protein